MVKALAEGGGEGQCVGRPTWGEILWREHHHHLTRFTATLEALKITLPYLPPQPTEAPKPHEGPTPDVPDKFLDGVTQAVMVSPVRLGSSGVVVDESTLLHLQLLDPRDPFTRRHLSLDTHERVADLQEQLTAWHLTR